MTIGLLKDAAMYLQAGSVSDQQARHVASDLRTVAEAHQELLDACEWFLMPDHAIGSHPELIRKAEARIIKAVAKARGMVAGEVLAVLRKEVNP